MSAPWYAWRVWPRVAALVLAACLGYTLMALGQRIALPPVTRSFSGPPALAQAGARPPASLGINVQAVQRTQLFGQAVPRPQIAPPSAVVTAPDTSLNLVLQGTLATEIPDKARAMICAPDGAGRLYKAGDTLPTGALLQSIYPDRVILLRNNRYETLRLRGKKTADSPAIVAAPQAPPLVAEKSTKLAQYRQQILAKPASMAEFIRLSPAEESGRLIGYSVLPGKNPQVLEEFGLQSGDVIISVNSTVLDSALNGLAIMQQLASSKQINLEVLRNGRPLSLRFSLD